jgi:hypothetical protein
VAQVSLTRSYAQVVHALRRQERYGGLNESNVRGWYVQGSFTELKPDALARRARAAEGRSGLGPSRHPKGGILAKYPAVLSAIREELLHL